MNLKEYKKDLLFLPLGGANEIGMNLNLYHLDGKWLMIDLGVGFAENIPGIDMLAPDIEFIREHRKDLLGIVLTHIHEDHLGAVQYLWPELKCPIYTTNFTANFLREKLSEYPFAKQVPIHLVTPKKELQLGPFTLDFIGLTHSTPEMHAVMVKTRVGNVLHTGDWKIDPNPVVGLPSDLKKVAEYGDEGVLAMVCDSTNVLNSGHSGSEGDLEESLFNIMADINRGLVMVATFASNVARILTITRAAVRSGRKVAVAGRSLERIIKVAVASGYLKDLPEIVPIKSISKFDRNQLVVIATGCQGEVLAAMNRIANGNHPVVKIKAQDTVIFSSKIIPGNEKKIFSLFNRLTTLDVDLITEKDEFVHVSGHPSRDELAELYGLARPQIAIPVHGETLHLNEHVKFAKDIKIPTAIQVANGDVVMLKSHGSAEIIAKVKSGYYAIDGGTLVPLEGKVIKTRRQMQQDGLVVISLVVSQKGKLLAPPTVSTPGLFDANNDRYLTEVIVDIVAKTVEDEAKAKRKLFSARVSKAELEQELGIAIRAKVKKILRQETSKNPMIEIAIHQV